MKRLLETLNSARMMMPLCMLASLLLSLGVVIPGEAGPIIIAVAIILGGIWAALLTWRVHRLAHTAQQLLRTTRSAGLKTHLPHVRRDVGDIGRNIRSVSREIASLKGHVNASSELLREIQTQAVDNHGQPTENDLISRISSVDIAAHGVSPLVAAVLRARLQASSTASATCVGTEQFAELMNRVAGDRELPWAQLDPSRTLELGVVELLAIEAELAGASAIECAGHLPPTAEIWVLGSTPVRNDVIQAVLKADPFARHIALPSYCEGVSVLKRTAS